MDNRRKLKYTDRKSKSLEVIDMATIAPTRRKRKSKRENSGDNKTAIHPNEWRKKNGIGETYGVGLVDLYKQGR
ncbi:hypothetical protein OEA_28040 (plasmid) [Priestia megaterium NCT-2]|uniref:hypothetical protein n=1 Tax=Priestia megaterium TaxID=1404 RepID=UPI0003610D9F|nr:hypothetical protein [Priestia megaterium]AYE53521.1 hypothetical protein OEA_28040 [Priestia megaterium NCT-2]